MSRWQLFSNMLKAVFLSWDEATFTRRLRHIREGVDRIVSPLAAAPDARDWIQPVSHAKRPERVPAVLPAVEKVGVVLQGPLCREDDFTLETVRYYRTTMPCAQIVVSTWNQEDAPTLRAIEQAGAAVLCQAPPDQPGISNINRQIASTSAGIRFLAAAGCHHVLKTRADTRLYSHHALQCLKSLLDAFPLRVAAPLEARLVVLDYATRLYFPYHPSDMLMFGRLGDMQRYWDIPLSDRPLPPGPIRTHRDLWEVPIPEMHLCERFLAGIGHLQERSIGNWWKALAEFFVVVDRETLDHYWQKHGFGHERPHIAQDWRRTLKLCGFAEWIHLLQAPDSPVPDEQDLLACEIRMGHPGA